MMLTWMLALGLLAAEPGTTDLGVLSPPSAAHGPGAALAGQTVFLPRGGSLTFVAAENRALGEVTLVAEPAEAVHITRQPVTGHLPRMREGATYYRYTLTPDRALGAGAVRVGAYLRDSQEPALPVIAYEFILNLDWATSDQASFDPGLPDWAFADATLAREGRLELPGPGDLRR